MDFLCNLQFSSFEFKIDKRTAVAIILMGYFALLNAYYCAWLGAFVHLGFYHLIAKLAHKIGRVEQKVRFNLSDKSFYKKKNTELDKTREN